MAIFPIKKYKYLKLNQAYLSPYSKPGPRRTVVFVTLTLCSFFLVSIVRTTINTLSSLPKQNDTHQLIEIEINN